MKDRRYAGDAKNPPPPPVAQDTCTAPDEQPVVLDMVRVSINMPVALHSTLTERAHKRGVTLTEYMRQAVIAFDAPQPATTHIHNHYQGASTPERLAYLRQLQTWLDSTAREKS